MAWVGHVWVDLKRMVRPRSIESYGDGTHSTVGTVSTSSLLWGLVDLDVLDDQVAGVETLCVGVGLCVLEEREEELGRLDWPAGLVGTKLLSCNKGISQSVSDSSFLQVYASSHLADSPCAVRPVLPA